MKAQWRTILGAGVVTGRIENSFRKKHESGWWQSVVFSPAAGEPGLKLESEPGRRSEQHGGHGVPDTEKTSLVWELPGLFLLCGNR